MAIHFNAHLLHQDTLFIPGRRLNHFDAGITLHFYPPSIFLFCYLVHFLRFQCSSVSGFSAYMTYVVTLLYWMCFCVHLFFIGKITLIMLFHMLASGRSLNQRKSIIISFVWVFIWNRFPSDCESLWLCILMESLIICIYTLLWETCTTLSSCQDDATRWWCWKSDRCQK